MGNEIVLENITPLADNEILIDSVRQWRSDCQLGQFKIGTSLRGFRIEIEIIAAKNYSGEYWGYELQNWLCLLFIDPDGVLSQIMFKTESLSNFEELYRQYRLKGESLLGKKIRLTMSKRASRANNGNYYAVEFEVCADKGNYAEAIAEFRAVHYSPQLFRQLENNPVDAPTPARLPEKVVSDEPEVTHALITHGNGKKRPTTSATAH